MISIPKLIEKMCLSSSCPLPVFEPDTDENEAEYKKIHDEYKNLVDFMLGSYMEDIGITSGQFEAACGQASTRIKSQFHQALFEQV